MTTTRARTLLCATLLVGASALPAPGCALLLNGTQPVVVRAAPSDAVITIDGVVVAPGEHALTTASDHIVRVEAPGHVPQVVPIRRSDEVAARFVVFDLLWFPYGLVFLLVDVLTDSLGELTPDAVFVRLSPAPPPPEAAGPEPAPAVAAPAPRDDRTVHGAPAPSTSPPPAPPALAGRTLALTVAADDASDARAARLCAVAAGGAATRLSGDRATRDAVLRSIRDVERRARRVDRVVVYLAGGVVTGAGGEIYLATADTERARPEQTAIPAATLRAYLERIEADLVLVLVEADAPDPARLAAALTPPRAHALTAVGGPWLVDEALHSLRSAGGAHASDDGDGALAASVQLDLALGGRGAVLVGSARPAAVEAPQ